MTSFRPRSRVYAEGKCVTIGRENNGFVPERAIRAGPLCAVARGGEGRGGKFRVFCVMSANVRGEV